jgi:hypothetical protein
VGDITDVLLLSALLAPTQPVSACGVFAQWSNITSFENSFFPALRYLVCVGLMNRIHFVGAIRPHILMCDARRRLK